MKISKKIEEIIEAIVKPIISDNGYEYIGTELKKAGDSKELIIYADKPGGLELEDCEKISRLIDPAIDEKDPIDEAYYLCVSSPGLDRALKTQSDFAHNIGKKVDVKLYRAIDGEKEFTGELLGYDEHGFTLSGDRLFLHKDTAVVKLHVDI